MADISRGLIIIIVGGVVGGIVMSFLWMVVLRYLAGFMVWTTIFLVNALLVGITLYCFSLAGLLGNNAFAKVGALVASTHSTLVACGWHAPERHAPGTQATHLPRWLRGGLYCAA